LKLIIEYYNPSNENRQKEYDFCVDKNINSKLFEQVIIFLEKGSVLPEYISSHKSVKVIEEERKTFQNLFDYCDENFKGDICVISNTDIIFDNTLKKINNDNIEGKMFCLTRWDILPNKTIRFFNNRQGIANYSQDSWIFKSPSNIKGADFHMGKPGCDNKMVYIAEQSGLVPSNPSMDIITKHLHTSNFRTYTPGGKETVSPPWWGLVPCKIDKVSEKKILRN
jgi:hypothetical protein